MLEPASTPLFPKREMRYTSDPPSPLEGDLHWIGWKLVTTLGTGADVSYFLPRLLEGIAENALFVEDVLAGKMLEIPIEHWTPRRIASVQAVLRALLEDAHAREDDDRAEHVETLQAAVP